MSLNNLGTMLSALGRREDALEVTREAADIYRTLAASRPAAFLPDLAMSLNNLGNRLSDLGRREEALPLYHEGLRILMPFFEREPRAFEERIRLVLGNYLRQAQETHSSPDSALIRAANAVLGTLETEGKPVEKGSGTS
jgi:tetratricopeptide (TPR) repeat protein